MPSVECFSLVYRDAEGTTAAAVVPAWGANVVGLSYQAADLMWPISVLEPVDLATSAMRPTSYGMPILAPTPGRVGRDQSGVFRFRGVDYRVAPSRHGMLRNLAWSLVERTPASLRCAVEVAPDRADHAGELFPFELRADYRIEVSCRTLRCELWLENTGEISQPLNTGWHPYLHRSGPCSVHIPARSIWKLDDAAEPTPTGEIVAVAGANDFRGGRRLDPGEHWDDVFTDLEDRDGAVACWLDQDATLLARNGEPVAASVRRSVRVSATADGAGRPGIRNMQLYTPPGRDAISLEPLSAPPDAVNLLARGHERADVCVVEPGGRVGFEIALGVDFTPR